MTPYEEKLAALGITNRGQLATGFETIGVHQFHESSLINRSAHRSDFIRPVAEDLTALNPPHTATFQKAARKKWAAISPEERSRRAKLVAATKRIN